MEWRAQVNKKELRKFGLMVGGIFTLIGCWPVLFHQTHPRLWALIPGLLLVGLGLVWPYGLRPVYRGWMAVGLVLGWINTRIILGIIFYGLLTPVGVFMRMRGKDFMRRIFEHEADTYRVVRSARHSSHLKRQF